MSAGPGTSVGLAQPSDQQKGAAVEAQQPGPPAAKEPSIATAIQRWFDLQSASVLGRYRYIEDAEAVVTNNEVQDSLAVKARFKLDPRGYYTVNGAVGTGATFTSGWNNAGIGSPRLTSVYLKQLFVAAAPVNGLQLSAGGLTFVRGESSEITSYDNDGYLVGERVIARHPMLYFNEITFTNAYFGDVLTPNVFARFHRLGEPNYRQLLVSKALANWLTVSADYTALSGVGTVRAAFSAKTRGARVVDLIGYEQYRRGGANGAFGFAVFGEKTLSSRAVGRAGYVDVDPNYGGLNADRFNVGRRWYGQADFVLTRDLSSWVFVSHAVHNEFAVRNATRLDVVFTFNVMGPLRRAGLFR
jgi:hypothetical protein